MEPNRDEDDAFSAMRDEQARTAAASAAGRSYGKLVALLASKSGEIVAAEDALSEAFLAALETWPSSGVPANPEAWLLAVARRRLVDLFRRRRVDAEAIERLQRESKWLDDLQSEPEIPDHRLSLMFACAHPAVTPAARAPLILQTVLGWSAERIAAAFLETPAAMSQRLVRAKIKIHQACIPFRIPDREELPLRLAAVLDAVYAAYGEGWNLDDGPQTVRRELANESIFLADLIVALLPREPEALGLLALLLHTEARRDARRTPAGEYAPLDSQDVSRWNHRMIEAAESLLHRAAALGSIGRYQLEAALQSAHVDRRRSGRDNRREVVRLYIALENLTSSPVVALNRALATADLDGPGPALELLDAIASDPRIATYQPYWAARASLLYRLGSKDAAAHAYKLAASLERDPAVRRFLDDRLAELDP